MLKQLFTFSFVLLLVVVFSGLITAQSLTGGDKDLYTGPQPKEKTPDGQNIPTPYEDNLALLFDNGPLITHPRLVGLARGNVGRGQLWC